MRLRDYSGAVKNVASVVPAIEERRVFNGTNRRMIEPCRTASVKPNALVFSFADDNIGRGFSPNPIQKLLIGNLTPETANEIINNLLTTGYADISGLKYQKEKVNYNDYVVDGGESGAYVLFNSCIFPSDFPCTAMNIFDTVSVADEDTDISDDGDIDESMEEDYE